MIKYYNYLMTIDIIAYNDIFVLDFKKLFQNYRQIQIIMIQ